MIRLILTLYLVLLAGIASAQTVRVTSGEHEGFARLVLQTGAPAGWTLTRTDRGYGLALAGLRREFDLSTVFRLIGRDRLTAIRTDPATRQLILEVGCACHAIAFDHRPGVIVIDIRDGPPPAGSAFELGADGTVQPQLGATIMARAPARPRPRPGFGARYDWLDTLLGPHAPPQPPPEPHKAELRGPEPLMPEVAGPSQPAEAAALQKDLIRSLADGAARGVVDLRLPPPDAPPASQGSAGMAQVRVTAPSRPTDRDPGRDHAGRDCPPDAAVVPALWGSEAPIPSQMAAASSGLVGELDRPDPEAVLRAAKFLLHLGFGAEARQVLAAFPASVPDRARLESLGHLADETPDPAPAFVGLHACGNAAALWSLLSDPAPPRAGGLNVVAVRAAFSGLPPHLRRLFGPRVVDRLLVLDEREAAESVRAALSRVSAGDAPEVALVEVGLALSDGDADTAARLAETAAAAGGPQSRAALVALVEAKAAARSPLSPDIALALAAMWREAPDPALARALALAQGLGGGFEQAMALAAGQPDLSRDLWDILARLGADDQLLIHAMVPPGLDLSQETEGLIAERLMALGFPAEAEVWLRRRPGSDPLALAEAALARGDGRAALRALAGLQGDQADAVRVQAGNLLSPAQAELKGPADAEPLPAAPPAAAGPAARPGLAESVALADRGAATRARLEDLLAALPPP